MRAVYVAALSYFLFCLVLIGWNHAQTGTQSTALIPSINHHSNSDMPLNTTGARWFARTKPYCNMLEVETHTQMDPPPATVEGTAYSAACFALAGKIDRAQTLIESLKPKDSVSASEIVFQIGHPIADAGDDKSAGPIMRLVLQFSPDNVMALYHAGMSEYALYQYPQAKQHLQRFVELYTSNDGWRANALQVLDRLQDL